VTDPDHTPNPHAVNQKQAIKKIKYGSLQGWLLVSLFQVLARLSDRMRMRLGAALAKLAPRVVPRRARIVRRNLQLCFPQYSDAQRATLMQEHFRALAQSFVDRGVLWFGTPEQIKKLVVIRGFENLAYFVDRQMPVMMLAPHFVGLDAAATRLTMIGPEGATMYSTQGSEVLDAIVRLGRARFHTIHLISRRDGVRKLIGVIKRGLPIYYLPDMDFGARGAVFVPFFGVKAATQTATAQLARQFDMAVVPIISHWNPRTGQYFIDIQPPLTSFPDNSRTLEQDTAHLNALLETWISQDPSQYYWVHRRFKTRPPGEPSLYE
jgi:Kdo2-lipid IVA lauroyltransferase/acyltransferase